MHWSWLFAGAASIGTATATVDIGPVPNADEGEIVKLQPEIYDRLTVPVTIGGQGPFHFLLDTGAQATVLSTTLAARLMLTERRPATLVGMASLRPVQTTFVPELSLGSRSFPIMTAPLLEPENIGAADGILGVDSLQDQRVLVDFEKQQIAVAEARELGGNRGFDIVVKARRKLGELIIMNARINGIRTAVLVDTGAQGSIGNAVLLQKLRKSRHLGDVEMTDVNGQELSGVIRLGQTLQIGDAMVNDFPIAFADSPTFHALGLTGEPALILGMR